MAGQQMLEEIGEGSGGTAEQQKLEGIGGGSGGIAEQQMLKEIRKEFVHEDNLDGKEEMMMTR